MELVKIGKYLKDLLLSDNTVAEYLNDKIFPLVAVEGTTFPFLVYRRSGFVPASNKDLEDEIVTMELTILSAKYEDGIDVTDAVLNALIGQRSQYIDKERILGTSEDFLQDTYIQRLTIEIYLK